MLPDPASPCQAWQTCVVPRDIVRTPTARRDRICERHYECRADAILMPSPSDPLNGTACSCPQSNFGCRMCYVQREGGESEGGWRTAQVVNVDQQPVNSEP